MGVVLVLSRMLPIKRASNTSVGSKLSGERKILSLSPTVAKIHDWKNGPWTEMNTSTPVIGIFETLSLVR